MSYYRDPTNVRDGEPSIEVRPAKPGLQVSSKTLGRIGTVHVPIRILK